MSRRAFTLIETLVGFCIFALLTGIIAAVFIAAQRYGRLSERVSTAQREAVLCMQAIGRELTRSHSDTLLPNANPSDKFWMLSWQTGGDPPVQYSPDGATQYQAWVGIWKDSKGDVRRSQVPLTGGPQSISDVDLTGAPGTIGPFLAAARQRRLAGHISLLQLEISGRLSTVHLESQTQNPGNPPTRYQVSSSFLME